MLTKLPAQNKIAAFDIDAQNTFTPVCPTISVQTRSLRN